MKKLFLVNLVFILLISCSTTKSSVDFSSGLSLKGEEAAVYYRNLLEDNESIELRYNYIYSLLEAEKYKEVIEEAEKAITLYPDYLRLYHILSYSYLSLNETENYITTLKRIIEKDNYNEEVYNLLLTKLEEINSPERLSWANTTLSLFPQNKTAIEIKAEESEFYSYLNSTI